MTRMPSKMYRAMFPSIYEDMERIYSPKLTEAKSRTLQYVMLQDYMQKLRGLVHIAGKPIITYSARGYGKSMVASHLEEAQGLAGSISGRVTHPTPTFKCVATHQIRKNKMNCNSIKVTETEVTYEIWVRDLGNKHGTRLANGLTALACVDYLAEHCNNVAGNYCSAKVVSVVEVKRPQESLRRIVSGSKAYNAEAACGARSQY